MSKSRTLGHDMGRLMSIFGAAFRLPLTVALFALALGAPTSADEVADFYAGKQLRVVAPFENAGGYGQLVRLIAAYLPKYLPGHPTGIPQYMPGAGGLRGTNYMAISAPRDGTVISILYDS